VSVAAELFRERGYDATSMQEIADRMGILKGSLYHYVRTKEDLLWVVMEPPLRELVETAQQILRDTSVPLSDRLIAVMEMHAESFEANYPHMFVMTRENGDTLSDQRRKDLDGLRRKYFKLLRDTIVAGQKAGDLRDDIDPSIAVHGIFGMLNWMFRWFTPGGRMKARDVARQFASIVIAGLVPAGKS
jgi:AcrR family transcriptional regulator